MLKRAPLILSLALATSTLPAIAALVQNQAASVASVTPSPVQAFILDLAKKINLTVPINFAGDADYVLTLLKNSGAIDPSTYLTMQALLQSASLPSADFLKIFLADVLNDKGAAPATVAEAESYLATKNIFIAADGVVSLETVLAILNNLNDVLAAAYAAAVSPDRP